MQSSSKISVVLMFAFGDSLEDRIYCTWSASLLHSRTSQVSEMDWQQLLEVLLRKNELLCLGWNNSMQDVKGRGDCQAGKKLWRRRCWRDGNPEVLEDKKNVGYQCVPSVKKAIYLLVCNSKMAVSPVESHQCV